MDLCFRMQRLWDQTSIVAPTQHNFDTKLTEADSYLQLLIEQIRDLEYSIEKVGDPRERQQLSGIGSNANALLETIKHTIVLLQIAKNTAQPVNGVYPQRRGADDNRPVALRTRDEASGAAGIQGHDTSRAVSIAGTAGDPKVPPVSYSSDDEDEEFFFDTQEETEHAPQPLPPQPPPPWWVDAGTLSAAVSAARSGLTQFSGRRGEVATGLSLAGKSGCNGRSSRHARNKFEPTSNKSTTEVMSTAGTSQASAPLYSVYDAAYEDDAEDESGWKGQPCAFGQHQTTNGVSLLTGLLASLSVGWLLVNREKRVDHQIGPTVLIVVQWRPPCRIGDCEDPKERMVEVVRWYLSAFHAGRKSSVAKKPYNPILGEIFRCYWKLPAGDKASSAAGVPVKDGPVPWATSSDLTFIAEQVSHHPPGTCGTASLQATLYCRSFFFIYQQKSKYLGMSIGVHNVGQGCIMFLRHDEEYVVNFPSGYGRSIFTVPWIELGGNVEITCHKTGYNALIQFHTKPLIGGKKHQLTAEVFPPNEKKPFMTVTGEWNGVMTAKYTNGEQAVFVDTTTLATTKKVVQPIQQQEPHESRRLWKEVTLALKNKDVNKATDSKTFLEEQQRREASERLHSGQSWKTRVFHMEGEHWAYDHSLQKRVGKQQK
ncbi:hypothetical protein HPB48_007740 [Haemaphysalis longicornis]|uniref:Oxysterol-binding protein n=1 Tax=Haemaphysalis longicornis TaxID=44386 RepID=A0A9J6G3E9_HAELO|nr:hypothetical protein HPB48_007740 [Haemaphysalis longicornis]